MICSVRRALVLMGLSLSIAYPAHAETAKCLIVVAGKTYLQAPCEVTTEEDGSFSVGVSETSRSKYFAYVEIDSVDHGAGYWNGVAAESHAGDALGTLTRSGTCWLNSQAKICVER